MGVVPAAVLMAGVVCLITTSARIHTVRQQDRSWNPADRTSVSVSADGRYVAFVSYAPLAATDTNRLPDIYVLDRHDGRVSLESFDREAEVAQMGSGSPRISADGAFLVYVTGVQGSQATRVIRRDRRDGSLAVLGASVQGREPDGRSRAPAISGDGRVVAFSSAAANLVPGTDPNGSGDDIYIYEAAARSITRLPLERGGLDPGTGISVSPALTSDGRFVAFASTVDSMADPHDNRNRTLSAIYLADRERGGLKRISDPSARVRADGSSWDPAISGDGQYVAFVSSATNLVANDRNRLPDVFLADVALGSIQLVSRSAYSRRAANGRSGAPAISADGRFVVFQSEASDLVCARECDSAREDINLLWDVFVFDRTTGALGRVSGDENGGWMAPSAGPAIDSTGRLIVFSSRQPTDVTDTANDFDLFLCDSPLRLLFGALREGTHRLHH